MNKSQIHAILQAPDEVFLAILQAGAMFHEANIHANPVCVGVLGGHPYILLRPRVCAGPCVIGPI